MLLEPAATVENDSPPARPPTEPGGVLVGEESGAPVASTEASSAPTTEATEVSSAPATLENDAAPARAPTESAGVLVGEASHEQPRAATPAEPQALPALQRVVHLPTRPRLRVSYWFDGQALKCEASLLDERRNLVHRSSIDTSDPTAGQIFSWVASRLIAELKASGVQIAVPVSLAPPEEDDANKPA